MILFLFVACSLTLALGEVPYKILNDGNKIPVIALGTGRGTAAKGAPKSEVFDAVYNAIAGGYRHIDTASIYGIEGEVGRAINSVELDKIVNREELFVTTKLWVDKHKKEQVVPALRESLHTMRLDYVDLYLIHFPVASKEDGTPADTDYLETWEGMEEAKALGLTKSIGVSNFNISQIDRLLAHCKVAPAVNEIEVNPTLTQEPLVAHLKAKNITVMAYSPFGFLVSRKSEEAPPPRYDDPLLVALGQKYNKTSGQIALRYLVDRDLIPIPKSTNKGRISENIDIFDFKLTSDEVASISAFNKNQRVIDAAFFKNLKYYPFVDVEKFVE